jgi:hypothetical protein
MININKSKNRLLVMATITVLITGLMLTVALNNAEAKVPKTGTFPLKCQDNVGSFYNPTSTGGLNIASGQTNCNALGSATVQSITVVTGLGSAANCINLATLTDADSYAISTSGFFTYKSTNLDQCFLDKNGNPATSFSFCGGNAGDPFTSKVTGTYTITGGNINGNPVSGGTGTVNSSVNHCAFGTSPYGNSVKTTIAGTIVY